VRNGRACRCGTLAYRSSVRDWASNRRVLSPLFPTSAQARAWLADQVSSLQAIRGVALEGAELGDVIDQFLEAAEEGRARDRWGQPYTHERLRELRGALSYVDAELGLLNVADVRRRDVQGLVDRLVAAALPVGRVYDVVDALDALYAYAIRGDIVGFSPVVWLALPGAAEPNPGPPSTAEAMATANGYPSGGFEPPPRSASGVEASDGAAVSGS
jgi:hypothetical protein